MIKSYLWFTLYLAMFVVAIAGSTWLLFWSHMPPFTGLVVWSVILSLVWGQTVRQKVQGSIDLEKANDDR